MAHRTLLAPALGLAAVVAAGLAAGGPVAASAGTAAPPGVTDPDVTVDPTALPRGANPRLAYLRTDTKVIHDGSRRVHIHYPGEAQMLAKVYRGYLLSGWSRSTGGWLAGYGYGGRRHLLVHGARGSLSAVVAPDGRRVAYRLPGSAPTRIIIKKVWSGAKLADRTFQRDTRIIAFGDRRLLLSQGSGNYDTFTTWWRPGRRKLDVYSSTGRARVADLTAAQVNMSYADGDRMESIPRDPKKAWDEPVGFLDLTSWAPDDRRILGLSMFEDVDSWTYQRLHVLSRDGRLLRTFGGYFEYQLGRPAGLVWEGNRTFLVEAYTVGSDGTVDKAAVVRCTVSGACERASAVFTRVQGPERTTPFLLLTRRNG